MTIQKIGNLTHDSCDIEVRNRQQENSKRERMNNTCAPAAAAAADID